MKTLEYLYLLGLQILIGSVLSLFEAFMPLDELLGITVKHMNLVDDSMPLAHVMAMG